ncbi:hypothetical protein CEXT_556061 [Caerostris extrusa]|uniref:Uncharacterized protein n=1 Tax=Caerostris extrusa TaxID=172846 RepID=A0AAV4UFK1_CAEEX|nr:hypothetical protein CEXT_556061 [Caerostris extrusa]
MKWQLKPDTSQYTESISNESFKLNSTLSIRLHPIELADNLFGRAMTFDAAQQLTLLDRFGPSYHCFCSATAIRFGP